MITLIPDKDFFFKNQNQNQNPATLKTVLPITEVLLDGNIAVAFNDITYLEALTRSHDDGWTISGVPEKSKSSFVNNIPDGNWQVSVFVATHTEYGTVRGDLNEYLVVDNIIGFTNFIINHPPYTIPALNLTTLEYF